MAIEEDIFPEDCWLAFLEDGSLSPAAKAFMHQQRLDEWQGKGAEHPCYGCKKDDCEVRAVEYHNDSNKYIVKPKSVIL